MDGIETLWRNFKEYGQTKIGDPEKKRLVRFIAKHLPLTKEELAKLHQGSYFSTPTETWIVHKLVEGIRLVFWNQFGEHTHCGPNIHQVTKYLKYHLLGQVARERYPDNPLIRHLYYQHIERGLATSCRFIEGRIG